MLKKILVFVVALVLVFSFCSTALAYDYISSTAAGLYINASGKASCVSTLTAHTGVDSVRINGYLKQLTGGGWVTIQSWTVSSAGTYIALNKEKYVSAGYTYKLVSYYYAYEGNDSESTVRTVYDSY